MRELIRDLFAAMTPLQRRRFARLQVLVVLRSFAEIAGVISIAPFMLVVSDVGVLQGDSRIAALHAWFGLENPYHFLLVLGAIALAALTLSSLISVFTTERLMAFSHGVGAEMVTRLYAHYMNQPWMFHVQHNSSLLTKRVAVEAARVTRGLLTPLVQANASIALAVGLALMLCLIDPLVTGIGVVIFTSAYLVTYFFVRKTIIRNGRSISQANARHFKTMSEGFGGIRELILRGSQARFIDRFRENALRISRSEGRNATLGQTPRYIVELVALGSMIGFVAYLVLSFRGDLGEIIPLLSIYGLAAFKLLPAFQKIYASYATMRGAQAAFESIRPDLAASSLRSPRASSTPTVRLPLHPELVLDRVRFTYPSKSQPAVRDVSLRLTSGSLVAFVGPSGAGKSTLIDLILGLIEPESGQIRIDGDILQGAVLDAWRHRVAFVPQSIYLMDASIAENVAFVLDPSEIDQARLEAALDAAQLADFVATLPAGVATRIGERGVQFSGGQRQRIGIARALYADASILVLDEATNSLDAGTEKDILDVLLSARGRRTTILVSHRLKTISKCDRIYLIDEGRVLDEGRFDELLDRNPVFRRLAQLS